MTASRPFEPDLVWRCRDRLLAFERRPLVMGIVNVTPDSFSDGGRHTAPRSAAEHARRLIDEGADIVDVGGESTRPGARPVGPEEELARVLPVVRALCEQTDALVSIDTTKAAVARACLEAGAHIINDVSALQWDPEMAPLAARTGAGVVLMHMQGKPRTMQQAPHYEDVVREVCAFLEERIRAAAAQGVAEQALAVDPGIGFGKTVSHNIQLLAGTQRLAALGRPVLIGLSRKSFLGKLTGREVGDRLCASIAALSFCVARGAHVMRVHDVKESCDAVEVAARLRGGL